MTKAEKIGIYFSAAALIISIASPIATYLWLNPNLKAFNDRARLQVIAPAKNGVLCFLTTYSGDPFCQVSILNIGKLPARDVQIVIQYQEDIPVEKELFSFEPSLNYETHNQGKQMFITLKRAIQRKIQC